MASNQYLVPKHHVIKIPVVWCEGMYLIPVGQCLTDICKTKQQNKMFKTHVVFLKEFEKETLCQKHFPSSVGSCS